MFCPELLLSAWGLIIWNNPSNYWLGLLCAPLPSPRLPGLNTSHVCWFWTGKVRGIIWSCPCSWWKGSSFWQPLQMQDWQEYLVKSISIFLSIAFSWKQRILKVLLWGSAIWLLKMCKCVPYCLKCQKLSSDNRRCRTQENFICLEGKPAVCFACLKPCIMRWPRYSVNFSVNGGLIITDVEMELKSRFTNWGSLWNNIGETY